MSSSERETGARTPGGAGGLRGERIVPIFWSALTVGIVLAGVGLASLSLQFVGTTTGQLVLCSGLGIVFGAFGSTATINYKGVVVTGVAAIAIVLLLVVDRLIEDDYVQLEISGDIEGAQVEVVGDENYLGAPRERAHAFIIIGREIRHNHLFVSISLPPAGDETTESEYLFECVRKEEVEPYLGSGQVIQWRFDKDAAQLLETGKHRKIADVGSCPRTAQAVPERALSERRWLAGLSLGVIADAWAAEDVDIPTLIRNLEASSSYLRRKARDALAGQGLEALRSMLDRLAQDEVSYRARLGIIVAMTEFLRENKDRKDEVSATMSEADLGRVLDAATHKDRTLRVYASEFLYDLGDPRSVGALFERFDAADDNGKYNLLVVLDGAYPYLDDAARAEVGITLAGLRPAVGPKTKQLIDRIIGPDTTTPTAAQESRYWVIAGSYTDPGRAQAHADRINKESGDLDAFVGNRQPNNAYYPVIVGDYVPRKEADRLVDKALRLESVRAYGSAPYLSAYPDRRP